MLTLICRSSFNAVARSESGSTKVPYALQHRGTSPSASLLLFRVKESSKRIHATSNMQKQHFQFIESNLPLHPYCANASAGQEKLLDAHNLFSLFTSLTAERHSTNCQAEPHQLHPEASEASVRRLADCLLACNSRCSNDSEPLRLRGGTLMTLWQPQHHLHYLQRQRRECTAVHF